MTSNETPELAIARSIAESLAAIASLVPLMKINLERRATKKKLDEKAKVEALLPRVKKTIFSDPGVTATQIQEVLGVNRVTLNATLRTMGERGLVRSELGPRNAIRWFLIQE